MHIYICLLYVCGMCVTSISSAYICLLYVCGMCVASIASTYICLLYVCGICVASIANAFPFLQKTIWSKGIGTISKKLRAPEITEKDRVKSVTEVLKNTIQVCVLDWWKRLNVSVEFSSLLLDPLHLLSQFPPPHFLLDVNIYNGFFFGGGGELLAAHGEHIHYYTPEGNMLACTHTLIYTFICPYTHALTHTCTRTHKHTPH